MKLTWAGTPTTFEVTVARADAPKVLEYSDTRWELEALGGGTRLTLWIKLDRRFISMGAAGWHISFHFLDRLLTFVESSCDILRQSLDFPFFILFDFLVIESWEHMLLV